MYGYELDRVTVWLLMFGGFLLVVAIPLFVLFVGLSLGIVIGGPEVLDDYKEAWRAL